MKNPFKKPEPNRRTRRIMKGELRNVDVELISLIVDDWAPKNGKSFVVKGGRNHPEMHRALKYKAEAQGSEGLIYLTFMEPNVKDTEGDFYKPSEVRKAMENFARKGRVINTTDVNHSLVPDKDFFVSESYILKAKDTTNYPDSAVGSWVGVVKCDDLENPTWKKFEKGEGKGASIYGKAEEITEGPADFETVKAELQEMRTILKKAGNDAAVAEIDKRLSEIEDKKDTDELGEVLKAFKDLSKSLNRVIAKGLQHEPAEAGEEDREVTIDGVKVTIKADKVELYKAIGNVDGPERMNILSANTTSLFIDEVIGGKPDDTFSDITVAPLIKDEKIDAGLVNDLIFKNESDGTPDGQDVGTGDIDCPTSVLLAKVMLKRDTVEFFKDKYGEEAFGAYVNLKISQKVEKAVRMLLFKGNRGSAVAKLKALDGIVTKAAAADDILVIENSTWEGVIETALLDFDEDTLEEQGSMVIYVNPKDLIRIKAEAKKSQNVINGRLLIDGKKVYYDEIQIKSRLIQEGTFVIGLSKFIILGYRTDAEMFKQFKDDWKWHWNIRIRFGTTYVPGFVKVVTLETPPAASDVKITGTVKVGEELTGAYTFKDINGDEESGTSFRWLICATTKGTYEAIAGATALTYTPVVGDVAKYLKFEVTPRSASGSLDGVAVLSSRTVAVAAAE